MGQRSEETGAVSEDKYLREFYVHGSHGQFPFAVLVTKSHFLVLGRQVGWEDGGDAGKHDEYTKTVVPRTKYMAIWLGKDPKKNEAIGNSLLIRLTDNGDPPHWYMYVGGEHIYTFRLADDILKYTSSLGRGGLAYLYATCEHGTVRLNEGWIVPNYMLEQENQYEQKHSMYNLGQLAQHIASRTSRREHHRRSQNHQ